MARSDRGVRRCSNRIRKNQAAEGSGARRRSASPLSRVMRCAQASSPRHTPSATPRTAACSTSVRRSRAIRRRRAISDHADLGDVLSVRDRSTQGVVGALGFAPSRNRRRHDANPQVSARSDLPRAWEWPRRGESEEGGRVFSAGDRDQSGIGTLMRDSRMPMPTCRSARTRGCRGTRRRR